jgi:hypothetical protein
MRNGYYEQPYKQTFRRTCIHAIKNPAKEVVIIEKMLLV